MAKNLKMLAESGLGCHHAIQGWKKKPWEELLDKMEVPWSKNKGRRSGVMRALERLKIVITQKDIRQLFQQTSF